MNRPINHMLGQCPICGNLLKPKGAVLDPQVTIGSEFCFNCGKIFTVVIHDNHNPTVWCGDEDALREEKKKKKVQAAKEAVSVLLDKLGIDLEAIL